MWRTEKRGGLRSWHEEKGAFVVIYGRSGCPARSDGFPEARAAGDVQGAVHPRCQLTAGVCRQLLTTPGKFGYYRYLFFSYVLGQNSLVLSWYWEQWANPSRRTQQLPDIITIILGLNTPFIHSSNKYLLSSHVPGKMQNIEDKKMK